MGKPTIEECREAVNELTKDLNFSEEELKHRTRWLYLLNRLSFWDDMPILLEEIKYQKTLK